MIWQRHGSAGAQVSYPDYLDLASASVFDGATALSAGRGNLRIDDRVERVNALALEPAGFALLGATPFLGRLLMPLDVNQPLALVSHALWRGQLNSDPAIIGRVLWMSGREYTIVGVLAPGFDFALTVPPSFVIEDNALWMLLDRTSPFLTRRDAWTYEVLVRRAPGRTLREAQAAIDAIGARLERQHPATNAGRAFFITSLHEDLVAPVRRPLLLVAVAAIIALGLALANLAILNLVRGAARQAEWSVRAALGGSMLRLRRQALTEHLFVTACGALGGLILGRALVVRLLAHDAANLPRPDAVRFDAPVWGRRGDRAAHRRRPRRAAHRHRPECAAHRVARRRRRRPPDAPVARGRRGCAGGYARDRRRPARLEPRPAAARGHRLRALGRRRRADVRLRRRVSRQAGRRPVVRRGAVACARGSRRAGRRRRIEPAVERAVERQQGCRGRPRGRPGPTASPPAGSSSRPDISRRPECGLLPAADFAASDRARSAHVTVINEALARVLFAGRNPLGQRIGVGGDDASGDWHEVIGVVADVRYQALAAPPEPRVYDLFGQHWGRTLYVIARSRTGEAAPLLSIMRAAGHALNPERAGLRTRHPAVAGRPLGRSATAGVAGRLGPGRRGPAAGGARRLRRDGDRRRRAHARDWRARGARSRAVRPVPPIAGEGARTIALGGVIGALGALLAGRLLAGQLFDVRAADAAWLIGLAALGVMLAALGAAARRVAAPPPPTRSKRCAATDAARLRRAFSGPRMPRPARGRGAVTSGPCTRPR